MQINGNNRCVSLKGFTMPVPYQYKSRPTHTAKVGAQKNGPRLAISFSSKNFFFVFSQIANFCQFSGHGECYFYI